MNTRASRCAIWRLHAPPSRYERIQPQAKERTAKLPPNRVTFLNGPNRDFPKWRRHSSLMQFRHLLLSLVLALLVASPCPARADVPAAKDVATIGDCLRKQDNKSGSQEADEAACLMMVAKPCMGGDEKGANPRRQIECLDRERLVWDKIINDSYKAMMKALEPDQQVKLREMQQ